MSDIAIFGVVIILALFVGIPAGKVVAPDGTRWAKVHRAEDTVSAILILIYALMFLAGFMR